MIVAEYLLFYPGIFMNHFRHINPGLKLLWVFRTSWWLNWLKLKNTRFLACEYKIGWLIFHVPYMSSFMTIVVLFLQHLILLAVASWRCLDWLIILQGNMKRILACHWEMLWGYVKNLIFVLFSFCFCFLIG